ncbi:MAG: exodeoxyribonuclease VII small subunit [Alphaproteobacteria bacterium]|nr:exodeoxyribonuclease VII small subunit [Alphaproteobacteria bacterium]
MSETQTELPEDIAKMSFEQALAELEQLVQQLESGQVDLEKSIDMYTRGTQLKQHCEAKLADAQARIEKVVVKGGSVSTEPAGMD